jgi:hypothetical protein
MVPFPYAVLMERALSTEQAFHPPFSSGRVGPATNDGIVPRPTVRGREGPLVLVGGVTNRDQRVTI